MKIKCSATYLPTEYWYHAVQIVNTNQDGTIRDDFGAVFHLNDGSIASELTPHLVKGARRFMMFVVSVGRRSKSRTRLWESLVAKFSGCNSVASIWLWTERRSVVDDLFFGREIRTVDELGRHSSAARLVRRSSLSLSDWDGHVVAIRVWSLQIPFDTVRLGDINVRRVIGGYLAVVHVVADSSGRQIADAASDTAVGGRLVDLYADLFAGVWAVAEHVVP